MTNICTKVTVRKRRTESIINEEYGFLDRNKGKESFLEYFKNLMIERCRCGGRA